MQTLGDILAEALAAQKKENNMFLIMENGSEKIVAATPSRHSADIVMDSLRDRENYTLYQPADEVPSNPGYIRYREQIISDLRGVGQTQKIYAMKILRSVFDCGLTEAKTIIEGGDPYTF